MSTAGDKIAGEARCASTHPESLEKGRSQRKENDGEEDESEYVGVRWESRGEDNGC